MRQALLLSLEDTRIVNCQRRYNPTRGGCMNRLAVGILASCLLAVSLAAQQSTPAFEVASIRPSSLDTRAADRSEVQPSGQFIVTNTTLDNLIRGVFEVQRHELIIGEKVPSWFASERWDIVGKGPPITNETAQRPLLFAMMRN